MAVDKEADLLAYLVYLGHPISSDINIVYIEGVNSKDWNPNSDALDEWNDVRVVLSGKGELLLNAVATTEPGRHYRVNPLNNEGAAVIEFGYHKDVWGHGLHRGYPALVQVSDIKITRDKNADGYRTGDKTWLAGAECGITQHGCNGGNGGDNIRYWSAGCLVGWSWNYHMNFIDLCRKTKKTRFSASLLDGTKFNAFRRS